MEAFIKKNDVWHLRFDPSPILKKDDKLFYFFSSIRPYFSHFWKKNNFCPLKSDRVSNDSEKLKMDFKHNF